MRKSRVFALVVASLVSTASLAGAQRPARQGAGAGRHAMGAGMGGRGARGLMRGIARTDVEKARLNEIHEKYRTEETSLHESLCPAREAARAARQKGDTAAARAAFDRSRSDREKMRALMNRERGEIRGALTADHQKQFDANAAEFAKDRAEWRKGGKGQGGRGGRRDDRTGQGR